MVFITETFVQHLISYKSILVYRHVYTFTTKLFPPKRGFGCKDNENNDKLYVFGKIFFMATSKILYQDTQERKPIH